MFPELNPRLLATETGEGLIPVALNVTRLPAINGELAVTVYDPVLSPKVRLVEAWPRLSVTVLITLRLCPTAPLGTPAIANVIAVFLTGVPNASVVVTTSCIGSVVLMRPV